MTKSSLALLQRLVVGEFVDLLKLTLFLVLKTSFCMRLTADCVREFVRDCLSTVVCKIGHFALPVRSRVLCLAACCSSSMLMISIQLFITPNMECLLMTCMTLYREVCALDDCKLLQEDLSHVCSWSQQWQLQLNWDKCEAVNITNKRHPLSYSYIILCHPIKWSSQICYLGVVFDTHLMWSAQCHRVASKATHVFNSLRRSLFGCHSTVKSLAYISAIPRICKRCLESLYLL